MNGELLTCGGASKGSLGKAGWGSGAAGKIFPGCSPWPGQGTGAGNWFQRTEVWFVLTNCEAFPLFMINARFGSGSSLYTRSIQKRRQTKTRFVSKSEVHGELLHRNQQRNRSGVTLLITSVAVTVLNLKRSVSCHKDKGVVKASCVCPRVGM